MVGGPILLTGAGGQVGGALLPLLAGLGEVVAPVRRELDLADASAIREVARRVRPRWIVNAAAYTAVDRAEGERAAAWAVNGVAPGVLGEEAARLGAAVVHFSTDYVFDGGGTAPWVEEDATGPLGVYGRTKLEGERALAASGAAHIIFRTSWVYGATGANFLRTILRLAREREELRIVDDQHGAPTWSEDLARLVGHTICRCEAAAAAGGEMVGPLGGVYHACGAGETTWFGFARKFVGLAAAAEPGARWARLTPIATAEYRATCPTMARRPANSRMDCGKLERALGFRMPGWEDSVGRAMGML